MTGSDTTAAAGTTTAGGTLTGFSIVITSNRRAEELGASLARRGATVIHAPSLRIIGLEEDTELLAAIRRTIAEPPDDVVVTTAIGFRGWVEAADAAGLAPDLLQVLARTRILARGPKARGAIRAAGLTEAWAASSETTVEVVDHLLDEGVAGRRVTVQLHGLSDPDLLARLERGGADLRTVPVYRWGPSPDPAAVTRAVESVCARTVDALVFTSAPGAQAFLDAAREVGRLEGVLDALSGEVVAAAVGPVTAEPLRAAGLDPLVPDRFRLGALVRALDDHLGGCAVRRVSTAGGDLEIRGQLAMLDGKALPLSPAPMAMLRALTRRPGEVVDRQRLLAALPGAADAHAVDVAVARLRAALPGPGVVETVVKRGYRLDVTGVPIPGNGTRAADVSAPVP